MGDKKKNRILLITGNGKGKTSAALGMVLRAAGHGMRVCLIQFLKNRRDTGELRALSLLPGVETHICGEGFLFPSADASARAAHRRAAEAGLALAAEKLCDPSFGLVVLDEVCGAVALGLLAPEAVCAAVLGAVPGVAIVLTGRGACRELTDLADTVSEVVCVRHGYGSGWPSQPGVEE